MLFEPIVTTILLVLVTVVLGKQQQQQLRETQILQRERNVVTLDGCPEHKEIATPYNENTNGYLLSGIMFTVRALSKPISITTFELDVRTDIAGTDLAVEVYTLIDGYTDVYNVESAWQPIANTKVVPVPGSATNSVLIPVQDFEKVFLSANELRSFYITMKNPYLESTVNALIGSGEVSIETDVLRIDVGSGLLTYKFPASFDTTIAPQFAGIIHYEEDTKEGCASPTIETKLSIDYKFLVNASGLDPSIIAKFNNESKTFFEQQIEDEDGYLREYKLKYQLTQLTDPTSTATDRQLEECQDSFTSCSEITVSASFEHGDGIQNDNLLYILYTMAESLRGHLKRRLDTTVLYIGKQARSATFTFTVTGVPAVIMSTDQTVYFEEFTKKFTSDSVSETIFEIVVQNQEIVSGALVLTGQYRGADAGGGIAPQSFTDNIENEFRNKNAVYIQGLAYNVLRPKSTLDKIDSEYFQTIVGFQVEMEANIETLSPTPAPVAVGETAPTTTGDGNAITDLTKAASDADGSVLVIVSVIVVICICITVIFLFICCKWNRKDVLDFDKNQSDIYDDDIDNDDESVDEKKKTQTDTSSEPSVEKHPSLVRSASRLQPSSRSLDKTQPLPMKGLQRGQSMGNVHPAKQPPKLERAKSGDGVPLPSRNLDFKKTQSLAVGMNSNNARLNSSINGLNSSSPKLNSTINSLNSSNSRLGSLPEERPQRRPSPSPVVGASINRSTSGEGLHRPSPAPNLQRSKSGDTGSMTRTLPPIPPSPSMNETRKDGPARSKSMVDPRLQSQANTVSASTIPSKSLASTNSAETTRGVNRGSSRNGSEMMQPPQNMRSPPPRTQSSNTPQPVAAKNNTPSAVNGQKPQQRSVSSERIQSLPTQKAGNSSNGPPTPQRALSLPMQQPGSTNLNVNGRPSLARIPAKQPMPPQRTSSARRPEAGPPSPQHRSQQQQQQQQQQPNPQSQPRPQHANSPIRTTSMPVAGNRPINSNSMNMNTQPSRPPVPPSIKAKMESAPEGRNVPPKRTQSMPVKGNNMPNRHNAATSNNQNNHTSSNGNNPHPPPRQPGIPTTTSTTTTTTTGITTTVPPDLKSQLSPIT